MKKRLCSSYHEFITFTTKFTPLNNDSRLYSVEFHLMTKQGAVILGQSFLLNDNRQVTEQYTPYPSLERLLSDLPLQIDHRLLFSLLKKREKSCISETKINKIRFRACSVLLSLIS